MLRACIASIAWFAGAVIFPQAGAVATASAASASVPQETVLEVEVNLVLAPEALVVLRDEHDALWLAVADFEALRLKAPEAPAITIAGRRYLPVLAIDGSSVRFDPVQQRAIVSVPARSLATTRVAYDPGAAAPVLATGRGAFLNYDVIGSDIDGDRTGAGRDRKSVVAGKSGDLGGRRIMKKKK